MLAPGNFLVVFLPDCLIVLRFREGLADHLFDTHASAGITALGSGALIEITWLRLPLALGIFSQGKLDSGGCAFKGHLLRGLAPSKFDDFRLSTNGISATVQYVRNSESARQAAIDVDVGGIDDVLDVYHRGIRDVSFI